MRAVEKRDDVAATHVADCWDNNLFIFNYKTDADQDHLFVF